MSAYCAHCLERVPSRQLSKPWPSTVSTTLPSFLSFTSFSFPRRDASRFCRLVNHARHYCDHPDVSTTELTQSPSLDVSPTPQPTIQPSIRLLFSLLSRRDLFVLVLPAILTSMLAGGVAPFMTFVVGQSFDAFAAFPVSSSPSEDAKRQLLRGVGLSAMELVALAVGALALSSITSSLWIWTGERNLVAGISQAFVGPALAAERSHTASAASLVDRAIASIATVKAFTAQTHEHTTLTASLARIRASAQKCHAVWGASSAAAQFTSMAMFVQGFWFGARLVRAGHLSPGAVMAVFWACLIAASNLQMAIPQLLVLAKGKFAMAALIDLAQSEDEAPQYGPSKGTRRPTSSFRGIRPANCRGHLEFTDVSFAYPSRPTIPVLKDISIFLPPQETSYIVGGSGSGKSTLAQLLLRMYEPEQGTIWLDDQDVRFLDEEWMRSHVAGVSQGCILFDGSVHENVAIGVSYPGSMRKPTEVSREEVIAACRAALMHEFVRDLPDGYDTQLGVGGANLSGGQKQRLAIARALLRNPTVLILDEATSALDATSRILVFEAIKHWRHNMTNVVITHDLSQIGKDDFVHVLKEGQLVEQGFRHALEEFPDSEFCQMAAIQDSTGGFQSGTEEQEDPTVPLEAIFEQQDAEKQEELEAMTSGIPALRHQSIAPSTFRPLTLGNWMFDVVADLTKPAEVHTHPLRQKKELRRRTMHIDIPTVAVPPAIVTAASHRHSLQFEPTSPTLTLHPSPTSLFSGTMVMDDEEFDAEKAAMKDSAIEVNRRRRADSLASPKHARAHWGDIKMATLTDVKTAPPSAIKVDESAPHVDAEIPFWRLVRDIYPTIPHKPVLAFGIIICLASGTMTPLFSFLLSQLFFQVSIGAHNVNIINIYGGIVLAVAAADGLFMGLKYVIMENAAIAWVTRIREECFARVLAQDKRWFDKSENSPPRLVQILIKDGDDARSLIATVLTQFVVVTAMLGVGLVWALVTGWQLTLVGFAIAPVFAGVMAIQTNLVAKCEVRNKRAREEVAKQYHEAISNVRGIRAMGFEGAFREKFYDAVGRALSTGVRGAFVEGCTYGISSALIYLAEALLFYVGAVLIARGTYTYLQMIQTLQLVVFSVSIGSQLMAFTQRIAKSVQATRDFNRLLKLSVDTDESRGIFRPPISGPVTFNHVDFSYPERPDVPVLKDLSIEIADSECVAVVGSSGSGKSTIAALLQRLYEPSSGRITIGHYELGSMDVHHLRDHVAVVSQQPNLCDGTIRENIAYGSESLSDADVQQAAKAAHVHDFIESLPKGYDTSIGENASLISGGQAQRLQIARALARPARILILDECTSSLDAANQAAVMETLRHAKVGRTTLVVTHKLPLMQMCDRIVVVHDGAIAEEGTYESLMERRGIFAQLASGGEWAGE
ncbi:Multidrug resistance protein 2 [Grifola frondosa]|uniref:Multidrug resistance protein 2 n=1 Tax=Grifola frondosa TaxID=5627 RepID=A0A1C7MGV5_GRIFR|nr:Multidrug resistance protein 2 [Grifola frondosa]